MNPRGPATQRLYDALAAHGHRITHQGGTWRTTCPAHGGDNPTALSFRDGDQGAIVRCWTRDCTAVAIAEAVGLRPGDLFDDRRGALYDYGLRPDGKRFTVHRKLTATGKTFTARNAPTAPELRPLRWFGPCEPGQMVVLAEGEKTADAIERLAKDAGYTAYCVATWPGGSGQVEYADLSPLAGREVVIAPDNDEAGEKVLGVLLRRLHEVGANVTYVWRTPAEFDGHRGLNDAADLALAGGTLSDLVRDHEAVNAPQGPERAQGGQTWHEVDLGPLLAAVTAGTYEPIRPTVCTLTDGTSLFYAGAVNGVAGDSGSAKTLMMQAAAARELEAGRHVVMIDFEDTPATAVQRLVIDLGVDPAIVRERFHYVTPDGDLDRGVEQVVALTERYAASLVIVDSLGEALAEAGANPNADEDVARFHRLAARPLAATGAAVVLIDHMAKNPGDAALFAVGSHRKRAAITGAQYVATVEQSPARGKAGAIRLTVAKDRHGARPARSKAARVTFDPRSDGGVLVTFWAEQADDRSEGGTFRPTELMRKVSRHLATAEGASGNEIEKAVGGNRAAIRQAIAVLVAEGHVEVVREGQKKAHYLLKPFTNEPRPTSPNLAPGEVDPSGPNLAHLAHPLRGARGEGEVEPETLFDTSPTPGARFEAVIS